MRELTKHEKATLKNIFKELKKCDLFIGKYDAKHGDENFMYGVSAVMESLAYMISEKYGNDFSQDFVKNMLTSEEKADIM